MHTDLCQKCVRVAEPVTRRLLIEELLNRTRLEKLLKDSFGNYCVQTALDYAEPSQRALLVEGIRPILPLIRNTPYGKRIQNKLQREQMDHFGGYNNHQALVNMALTNQGLGVAGGRLPPSIHQGNPLRDVYGGSNGLYSNQTAFAQSPVSAGLSGLQTSPIEGYVLQSNSGHSQGLSPSQTHSNGFGSAFGNGVSGLSGTGGFATSLNDPYARSSFGYGM
jgi:hypothetical protein